jgi:hypothetical protein
MPDHWALNLEGPVTRYVMQRRRTNLWKARVFHFIAEAASVLFKQVFIK